MGGWTGYIVDEALVERLRKEADAMVSAENWTGVQDRELVDLLRLAADRIVRLNRERSSVAPPYTGARTCV